MTDSKFSLMRVFAVFLAVLFLTSASLGQDQVREAVERLKNPDPNIRRGAIEQLSRINDKTAGDAVLAMLDDPGMGVKNAAIRAVGFHKDSRAVEALLGFLDDSDSLMNQNVVWALGEIGDARAFEPLLRLFNTGDLYFKVGVAYALSGLKDSRAFDPIYRLLMESRGIGDFAGAIIRLGPLAVEPLCRKVKEADDTNRFSLAGLLAAVADERAIPTLIWLLENKYESGIPKELSRKIGAPAIDALLSVLKSENPYVRQSAVSALGQIQEERAVEALLSVLGDKYPGVRQKAVEALANFTGENVGRALVGALGDESQEVRQTAIQVLANFSGNNIEQILIDALDNPNLQFDVAVVWGRKRDARAVPYLIEALKGKEEGKAGEATWTLVLIGKPAVESLIEILLDKNKEYPEREIIYKRQQEELQRQLAKENKFWFPRCGVGEPSPPIHDPRRRAAVALGNIRDERAFGPLTAVLKDKSAALREDAAKALIMLGSKTQ